MGGTMDLYHVVGHSTASPLFVKAPMASVKPRYSLSCCAGRLLQEEETSLPGSTPWAHDLWLTAACMPNTILRRYHLTELGRVCRI